MPASYTSIEPLESRIAPAGVTVSYTDIDGDLVKVKVSKGPLNISDFTFVGGGDSGQLAKLDLSDPAFSKTKVTVTVAKKAGGDGLAHIGYIDATGIDISSVSLKGDLGKITAGNGVAEDGPGLGSLKVGSIGIYGLVTQGGGYAANVGVPINNLESVIRGDFTTLKVAGDFIDASLVTSHGGNIKTISIGGSLIGNADASSGSIQSNGSIGSISIGRDIIGGAGSVTGGILSQEDIVKAKVGGNIIGGAGYRSGGIAANGDIGNVTVGHDIIGGAGEQSGGVVTGFGEITSVKIGGGIQGGAGDTSGGIGSFSGELKSVTLAKDLRGGTGDNSGGIATGGKIGKVKIGLNVIGGAGVASGTVYGYGGIENVTIGLNIQGGAGDNSGGIGALSGNLGKALIKGNVIGGSITGAASLEFSGGIIAKTIDSVTINGSLIAGTDKSSGDLVRSGSIAATDSIASIVIKGGIVGNASHSVVISARGQTISPATGDDVAIASISVGKDVHYAQILAGFTSSNNPANADASIGKITVAGNWHAASIVAGAEDLGAPGFDTGDDVQMVSDDLALVAHIASIQIKGSVSGTVLEGDHFGFVAEEISALKIGKNSVDLTGLGKLNFLLPFTDDVSVLEVGPQVL